MKNKTTIGLGLLALAAGAAWYYWRQRRATDSATATPDSPFNRTGQIGSNFNTDVTPELVALAFDYSQQAIEDTKPCWEFSGTSEKDRSLDLWIKRGSSGLSTGEYGFFNSGTRPSGKICRGN